VQNIKLTEYIVRGTSTSVRAPRLDLTGAEKKQVEQIVSTALAKRPDLARYGF
jgi:4-hydroxy-tetrahydrodipicolinate synthase